MMKRNTGRAPSLGNGLMKGLGRAAAWTLMASMATAWMVGREILKVEHTGYAAIVILLVCGILLGKRSAQATSKERLIGAGVGTGLYFLCLLVVNWLFFGGKAENLWVTLLVLLAGATLGSIQLRQGRGGVPTRRYKIPKS